MRSSSRFPADVPARPESLGRYDAAIDVRLERGMTPIRDFTGHERDRCYQRPTETEQ